MFKKGDKIIPIDLRNYGCGNLRDAWSDGDIRDWKAYDILGGVVHKNCCTIHLKGFKSYTSKGGENMNPFLKVVVDKDTQKLIEAGYLDTCLNLTEAGFQELKVFLFIEYRAELLKKAEAKLKAEKSEKS